MHTPLYRSPIKVDIKADKTWNIIKSSLYNNQQLLQIELSLYYYFIMLLAYTYNPSDTRIMYASSLLPLLKYVTEWRHV